MDRSFNSVHCIRSSESRYDVSAWNETATLHFSFYFIPKSFRSLVVWIKNWICDFVVFVLIKKGNENLFEYFCEIRSIFKIICLWSFFLFVLLKKVCTKYHRYRLSKFSLLYLKSSEKFYFFMNEYLKVEKTIICELGNNVML